MDLEEETPIVETKPFVESSSKLDHGKSENQKIKKMSATKRNEMIPDTLQVSGSSTDSSGWGKPLAISPPTSPSSSSSSSESYSKMKAKASASRSSSKKVTKNDGIDIKRREDDVKNQEASDQMSESYHEIFDTLMPPETAKARLLAESASETEHEDINEALSSCNLDKSSSPTSMNADEISTSKRYLTTKLVEDSLKWQRDKITSQMRGATGFGIDSKSPSPYSSPVHRGAIASSLHSPLKLGIPRPQKLNINASSQGTRNVTSESSPNSRDTTMAMQTLDPNCILDIERSARHLATSVDEMVENLSGLLQGISALTVDTVETYRDGVCKTCDAVDGNIKSMYQVMAKVEELNKSMGPAYKIADQVKDIKRLLDLFENALNTK